MDLVTMPPCFWSLLFCLLFAFGPSRTLFPQSSHQGQAHAEVVGTTAFDVYRDQDAIHLVLEEETAAAPPKLLYRVSRDEGRSFSEPIAIPTESPPCPGHRGNDPQIAASGLRLVVAWTGQGTGYGGRGRMGVARSLDGGRHWLPGKNPADDGDAQGAHAFLDLSYDFGGRCHLVWLDERNGTMGLRSAYSDDAGQSWSANRTIDPESCSCCPNALLWDNPWLFVLYRMGRPRDTAIARSSDRGGSWERLGPLGDFHWEFAGCPHWGSGLAPLGSGATLSAAVQTGKPERAGLYFFQSSDQGRTWSAPRALAGTRGRFVDLAASGEALCATWEESSAKSTQILAASSRDGGRSWDTPRKMSQDGIWATHPRVVGTKDGFLILWTESSDPIHVRWNRALVPIR